MAGLKTIYSREGVPLTDVKASVVLSSLLNDIGEAVFSIATSNSKCKRQFLEFGNYVVIQHDTLAAWVGIIDTPRVWHHGSVEIHAFEVPYILQYRLPPANVTISGTPGNMVSQLITYANTKEDTLIRMGNTLTGSASTQLQLTDTVYSHIKQIATENNHDWMCSPQIDSEGKLTIRMDWLETAGISTNIELTQGKNIQYGETPLEESGELLNSIEAMTEQIESGAITAVYSIPSSYGLREMRKVFTGTTDESSLISKATELLKVRATPDISTPLFTVNKGQVFQNVRLGNIMKYRYTNVGFDGDVLGASKDVRIEGYRFDESAGTCELFTGKVKNGAN